MVRVSGKAWRFGDDVDTDQIIPAERLLAGNLEHLGDFIFEKVRPGMSGSVADGDVLVAGRNFGCGSSREHAPMSLMQAGFSAVVASSFSRIFYRNAVNIGLLAVECGTDIPEGHTVSVDTSTGKVRDETSGTEYSFPPYPEFIGMLVECGGLMNAIREGKI